MREESAPVDAAGQRIVHEVVLDLRQVPADLGDQLIALGHRILLIGSRARLWNTSLLRRSRLGYAPPEWDDGLN
jgi:hypothetical protein